MHIILTHHDTMPTFPINLGKLELEARMSKSLLDPLIGKQHRVAPSRLAPGNHCDPTASSNFVAEKNNLSF